MTTVKRKPMGLRSVGIITNLACTNSSAEGGVWLSLVGTTAPASLAGNYIRFEAETTMMTKPIPPCAAIYNAMCGEPDYHNIP